MPVLEQEDNINSRHIYVPSEILNHGERDTQFQVQADQAETESTHRRGADTNADNETGLRFKINFQENRLRFDQTFPEGLGLRMSQSEFEIILEHIHREFLSNLVKSQKSVRTWSAVVAGTAPIAVGFFLSAVLARRLNRHQRALKNFWLALRTHLKNLNRDIYFARGIEWRIERDLQKITERDVYNKFYMFNIEIVFRKIVASRPVTENFSRRTTNLTNPPSLITTNTSTLIKSLTQSSQPRDSNINDADLYALLSTGPGGENYNFNSENVDENNKSSGAGVGDINVRHNVISSPFLVSDHVVTEDEETIEIDEKLRKEELIEKEDEVFLVTVDEPIEVTEARVLSTYEPPCAVPEVSVFSPAEELEGDINHPKAKMTFADLLRASFIEDKNDLISAESRLDDLTVKKDKNEDDKGVRISALEAVTAAITTAGVTKSSESSPEPTSQSTESTDEFLFSNEADELEEEVFAKRRLKKFNRTSTLATQLYAIPESPPADAVDDAEKFLNASTVDENKEISDLLGFDKVRVISDIDIDDDDDADVSLPMRPFEFEDNGTLPVAAYPLADSFSALYETDEVVPLHPAHLAKNSNIEYTDVDGEIEDIRRKKWRVAPENADKLSRVKTMCAIVHPASRRSSYLPTTKNTSLPVNFGFNQSKSKSKSIL